MNQALGKVAITSFDRVDDAVVLLMMLQGGLSIVEFEPALVHRVIAKIVTQPDKTRAVRCLDQQPVKGRVELGPASQRLVIQRLQRLAANVPQTSQFLKQDSARGQIRCIAFYPLPQAIDLDQFGGQITNNDTTRQQWLYQAFDFELG